MAGHRLEPRRALGRLDLGGPGRVLEARPPRPVLAEQRARAVALDAPRLDRRADERFEGVGDLLRPP
jgi:hypothetical protein